MPRRAKQPFFLVCVSSINFLKLLLFLLLSNIQFQHENVETIPNCKDFVASRDKRKGRTFSYFRSFLRSTCIGGHCAAFPKPWCQLGHFEMQPRLNEHPWLCRSKNCGPKTQKHCLVKYCSRYTAPQFTNVTSRLFVKSLW